MVRIRDMTRSPLLSHVLPIGLGAVLSYLWLVVVFRLPVGVGDSLWGRSYLPEGTTCGPWENDTSVGKECRRCNVPMLFHRLEILQRREKQEDGSVSGICRDFKGEIRWETVIPATVAGGLLWLAMYFVWSRWLSRKPQCITDS